MVDRFIDPARDYILVRNADSGQYLKNGPSRLEWGERESAHEFHIRPHRQTVHILREETEFTMHEKADTKRQIYAKQKHNVQDMQELLPLTTLQFVNNTHSEANFYLLSDLDRIHNLDASKIKDPPVKLAVKKYYMMVRGHKDEHLTFNENAELHHVGKDASSKHIMVTLHRV